MSFDGNSIQVTYVTPEMAAEFLRGNYQHNRKMNHSYVTFLAREMREGRFIDTEVIHIMYRNGEPSMVNGQHTCAAIILHGAPVRVTVRKESVKEAGQIAMTYAFGHDTGRRRSFNDATTAYNLPEVTGLTNDQVGALSTAIRHIRNSFNSRMGNYVARFSPADIVEGVIAWSGEARLVFTCVRGDAKAERLMRKRGSLPVAIVTMYYQREKALEFWRGIAHPDNLAYADPRNAARRVLDASVERSRTDKKISSDTLSRQLARCWNAFYRGDMLKIVQPGKNTEPIELSGTPYNGRQESGFLASRNGAAQGQNQLLLSSAERS